MPDQDAFRPHEDFSDEQADDPLTFGDRGALGRVAQPREEALEVLGKLEIRLPVDRLGVECLELSPQGRRLLPELGRPTA